MVVDVVYRGGLNIKYDRPLKIGEVYDWSNNRGEACQVAFWCPCGQRIVYVSKPPHSVIEFDDDGLLTIKGSIGYESRRHSDRPKVWCHLQITKGRVTIHDDVTCPGGDL